MKQYKRSSRVGEQILRDISNLLGNELIFDAAVMVTFTHVKVSDDLRYATVYYSCLDEKERNAVSSFLEHKKKRIRFLIGKNLKLHHIPEFSFKYDSSIEEGIRIEKLLNEIKTDSKE